MGGRSPRAMHIYSTTKQLVETRNIVGPPSWYNTVHAIPPGDILTRPLAVQHPTNRPNRKLRKKHRTYLPQPITYEEDLLRKHFFKHHPWELARPRPVLETDGRDGQRADWSRLVQDHVPVTGESVVQRQLHLMHEEKLSQPAAYEQARKEFYSERQHEDVERRVAREEASYVGAQFGPNVLTKGMRMEDRTYEIWKARVTKDWLMEQRVKRAEQLIKQNGGEDVDLLGEGAADAAEA